MAAGDSLWNIVAGGGQARANASQLARWMVQLGVCTGSAPGGSGVPNALLQAGDQSSLLSLGGLGPLVEASAMRLRGGQPCFFMPLNPSAAGGVSAAVTQTGSGNATMALSVAPHVAITVKCVLGGVIGTAAFQFSLNGGLTYGPTVTSVAAAPWVYLVPGTFCSLSFAAGTYVINTTNTISITGTVTPGALWVGTVTQTSSPIDAYEFYASVATVGGFGVGVFSPSLDGGPAPFGGGSTEPNMIIPTNGQIVIPKTGLVLQIGQHTILITMTTGGALGTAIYSYAIDGGTTVTAQATTPNSGTNYVVTFPNTGVTVTFAPGTYVITSTYTIGPLGGAVVIGSGGISTVSYVWAGIQANDTFTFLATPPSYSTSDLNTALTALQAVKNYQWTAVHLVGLPSSTASAFSQLATLDAAMVLAQSNGALDWQGLCECPSKSAGMGLGDVVQPSTNAIRDTADTDAVIVAARGADTNRSSIQAGTYRMVSPLTGRKPLRPTGWVIASRYVDTDPAQDISALVPFGALGVYIPPGALTIGRDESLTPGLDAVQVNTLRTYIGRNGAYLTITSGGAGWKNCSQQASWQDAGFVRILNVAIAQLRPIVQNFLGQRPAVNGDGTIEESIRRAWSSQVDSAFKKAVGLLPGGGFSTPQASFAIASVSPASQLGQSPKQLIINYTLVSLGFVSSIQNNMYFSNVLPS